MSEQKPKLKLKFGAPKGPPQADAQEAAVVPPSATTVTPKLTLKFGSSAASAITPSHPKPPPQQAAAAAVGPKPSKSGRKTIPTAKKRTLDAALASDTNENESDSEPLASTTTGGGGGSAVTPSSASKPPLKKIRISAKGGAAAATHAHKASGTTPIIRVKRKGQIPERPLGVGYDSEASDREEDPSIDEDFILRMVPGEDCEYLRSAIKNGTLGLKRDKGGADVRMRFLTNNGRRACITIRGRHYAAVLVDLPCVIEAMKSWNRKEFYKSADVCQMLLVLGRCKTEEEAVSFDIRGKGVGLGRGELDEKTWAWAHGITPPMRWVRKRRFRKRISTKVVEEDERVVERLLADDAAATGGSSYRHVDLEALEREQLEAEYEYEDADGEVDEEGAYGVNGGSVLQSVAEEDALLLGEDDDDLEAHFEAEMLKQAHEGDLATSTTAPATLISGGETITESPAATPSATATPSFEAAAAAATPSADDASSEDDDDVSDDDEGAGDRAPDDDALEEQQDRQRTREEIADLEAAIAREEQRLKVTPNQILKQKIAKTIQGLRKDLELKVGEEGDEGDEED